MSKNKKRLHKSDKNKIISGVCGGIAKYFDIDPTIVRLVWFIVSWFFGIGVVAYIVLAIIMPEE